MPLITRMHQQRCMAIEAEKAQGKTEAEAKALAMSATASVTGDHDRQVILSSLDKDLERLKELQSVEEKVGLKTRELLPKYLPHVQQYLQSGEVYPNPLLVRCAIWAIDADDLETAMPLVLACVEQQQNTPLHFKRDLPGYFVEAIAEWAERQLKAGDSPSPYIDIVCAQVRDGQWLTDNIIGLGKAFKVAGMTAERNEDFAEALAFYREAQQHNEKAGCKTKVKDLTKKLGQPAQ